MTEHSLVVVSALHLFLYCQIYYKVRAAFLKELNYIDSHLPQLLETDILNLFVVVGPKNVALFLEIARVKTFLLPTRSDSRICIRTYFFCKKKHTHTHKEKVTETKEKRKKETKEEKRKEKVVVVNIICEKANGIQ